ncbi:MAG: RING finger protein [Polyangiales bacterium]
MSKAELRAWCRERYTARWWDCDPQQKRGRLAEAREALREEAACVVCREAPKARVLTPCGHQQTCGPCGDRIIETTNRCPMCRTPIKSFTDRVF